MRFFSALILSFFVLNSSYSQNAGKIFSKSAKKAEIPNIYYYQPPKHLVIPHKIYASLVYEIKNKYYYEIVAINKLDGRYQFSYKANDSAKILILTINDEDKKPIDNNNESGFVIYLNDKKTGIPASAYIEAADLLSYYAPLVLKLNKQKLRSQMIKLFERGFNQSAVLKNGIFYNYYFSLLYQEKGDTVKPMLLAYAKQMASSRNDEESWMSALYIYRVLHMEQEYTAIESKAIAFSPDGKVAQSKFLNDFSHAKEHTEQSILTSMNEYVDRFKDTSTQMKYTFNMAMIDLLITEKEWSKLPKYEAQLDNNPNLAHIYNAYSLGLTKGQQYNSNNELNIAKTLSRRSLDFTIGRINQLSAAQKDGILQRDFNSYVDTYALILYKSGEYDSAFYYENAIFKQRLEVSTEFMEHYAMYAEKVKGEEFACQFITEQLLKGVNSPIMLEQLKSIDKRLGKSDLTYFLIRDQSVGLAKKRCAEEIKNKFGSVKSKDFTLKDIQGRTISLLSFRNKVVVLDFWATWCAPCRASFSGMQEIINKYKSNKDVVFLFIDTWENEGLKKTQESVRYFLKGNNYNFQVLFDEKNKIVEDYKVNAIPAEYIIDKSGNIVYMGDTSNLALLIENLLN